VKTSLTVVDLYASAREIKSLVGRRVENIYTTSSGYLFKFSGGVYLTVNEARASLTGTVGERDYRGAETLRGLIRDERLTDVYLPRFDKLLVLKFGDVELVAELLRPFNLIAVRDGKVIWLDHYYRGKDREVKAGAPYTPPPMPYVDPLARAEEAAEVLRRAQDVKKALSRELGLGPEVAEEIYARSSGDAEAALRALRDLVEEVSGGQLRPTVYMAGGVPVTVTPVKYISVRAESEEEYDAFWKALDRYFADVELRKAVELKTAELKAKKAKLEQSIAKLRGEIQEYRKRSEELYSLAKTMLSLKYELEEAIRAILRNEEVGASIRILDVNRANKEAVLEHSGLRFKLRLDRPVGRQIEEVFEEAKDYARRAAKAEEALKRLEEELAQVEGERAEAERAVAERVRKAAERAWFEKFRWFLALGRVPAIGGRDASQNEAAVRRYLKDDYLFFHADVPGASAVVAKPTQDEAALLELAQFAASYSRAWRAGIHAVDVFYVPGRQVSKQPPSGEYLARGSFMIYGSKSYIRHVRLELAVGMRDDGGVRRIVAAPPKSIAALAERYVVVTPGSGEKSRVAKEIARRWKAEQLIDEIIAALPGPSTIGEWGSGQPMGWDEIKAAFSTW
jgi:predicted ribosome quality control (RQC) complex YloA/Tae2 family protein